MTSTQGQARNPAKYAFQIDLGKRYYVCAAGATSLVSGPSVGGKLWYYDGQGLVREVSSWWASTNNFSCVVEGETLLVENAIDSAYTSGSVSLLATLIPLE